MKTERASTSRPGGGPGARLRQPFSRLGPPRGGRVTVTGGAAEAVKAPHPLPSGAHGLPPAGFSHWDICVSHMIFDVMSSREGGHWWSLHAQDATGQKQRKMIMSGPVTPGMARQLRHLADAIGADQDAGGNSVRVKRKIDPDRLRMLVAHGENTKAISAAFGAKPQSVYQAYKRFGIERARANVHRRRKDDDDHDHAPGELAALTAVPTPSACRAPVKAEERELTRADQEILATRGRWAALAGIAKQRRRSLVSVTEHWHRLRVSVL